MHKEPNHIALNQTMHHQTKAYIIKSSCAQKRQNRAHLTLTNTIFFGLCPSADLLKKQNISDLGSVSIFRQRSNKPGKSLRLSYFPSPVTTETVNLLKYVPQNRSSPWAVAEKWQLKN
jgi:hypothetical protein